MAINLHALRILVAVADAGGFTKAAHALRLSQPAVSKAVIGLERDVAMPLIDRGPRTITLTAAGRALVDRARELFAVERAAEEELRAIRGLDRGVLHVGASTTIATYLLPPLLADYHAAHPAIRLRVTSANTRTIARMLRQRRLDVALVEGPVDDPRIEVLRWREDELVVITAPDHPLVRRRRVRAADLADQPFIVREPGSGTRDVAAHALAASGIAIRAEMQLGSTVAITQAVASRLGIAIVSRVAAADLIALGRLAVVRVHDLVIRRPLTELRLGNRAPSAATVAFRALLGKSAPASRRP
jgi:DNA-binding transcriptional LysR family regulator